MRLSCAGCGGTVAVRRGRRRPCRCGHTGPPVYRDAGWRPQIVEYIAVPEARSVTETRRLSFGECRAAGDTITGHAAIFGEPSSNLGGFIEILEPGAFDGSLAEGGNVLARYNHEAVIGSTDDGRLNVWTDPVGLAYSVRPRPSFAWLVDAVRAGDVTSSSFAFRMRPHGDVWGRTAEGWMVREVRDVGELIDVAPVDEPAYPSADDVTVRGLAARAWPHLLP